MLLKRLLAPPAALFLALQAHKLLLLAGSAPINATALRFLIAWLIALFVTGVFALPGFVYPTQRLLPARYYRVDRPKRLSRWFRLLRVEWFRAFLLATLWRNRRQRAGYFSGSRADLEGLAERSRKSEFGHLLPFLLLLGASGWLLAKGRVAIALFVLGWNVFGNLYPIVLQRHHRMRIQRLHRLRRGYGRAISGVS